MKNLNKIYPLGTPGSEKAKKNGCKCPVLDNGKGRGAGMEADDGTPLFWVNGDCSIHNVPSEGVPNE